MELKPDICPRCGSVHTTIGKQFGVQGGGKIVPQHAMTPLFSTEMYYVICFECGTVIRSYVSNPKVLDKPDTL